MRHTLAALSLFTLAACDTAPQVAEDPDGQLDPLADENVPVDDVEYDLTWDDPSFMPEVDRWAPENMLLVDVPLGTSVITDVDEWSIKGESGGDRLGISVSAGNFNGFGRNDIVMGSVYGAGAGANAGAAYVWKSLANDNPTAAAHVVRADASKTRVYGTGTEKAGELVASGGDHDGDGTDDLLMGARNHTHNTDTWKTNAGALYVVPGGTWGSTTLPTGATATIEGVKAYEYLGAGVSFLTDQNADGFDEILVGATGGDLNGTDSGTVYLINGPITADANIDAIADASIAGEGAGDGAGARPADAGDINADGTNDIVVGVRGESTRGANAGSAYLITSTPPSNLGDSDTVLRGNVAGSAGGNHVAGLGDLNQDGYDDVGIGSLGHGSAGFAYVVFGSASTIPGGTLGTVADIRVSGQLAGDQFGSTVFSGDWDNDGDLDLGVAANRQSSNDRGAVYFFIDLGAGSHSALNADAKVVGANSGDYLGSWVAVAENTDWWGYDKVVIGASGRNGDDRGAVYLLEY